MMSTKTGLVFICICLLSDLARSAPNTLKNAEDGFGQNVDRDPGRHDEEIKVEKNETREPSHLVNADEVEEELILTHAQKVILGMESERPGDVFDPTSKRKYSKYALGRPWPNGIIPWEFDATKPLKHQSSRDMVMKAIQQWELMTCLKFVPRTTESEYLKFRDGDGCSSYVGKALGGQTVTLKEPTCISLGTVVHEIGHAIGFEHEQVRSDRDTFVEILFNNIRYGNAYNFYKDRTLVNVEYDLESVMQYGLYAFTKNNKPTIRVKNKELEFLPGNRRGLTFYDAKMANLQYKCKGDCTNTCDNHGYPFKNSDGSCICKCPRGLTGNCTSLDTNFSDVSVCGGIYILKDEGDTVKIHSPNYPNNYDLNKKCVYVIKGPDQPNSGIILTFTDFDVDEDGPKGNCMHSLEVNANLIGQTGPKYCGNMKRAPHLAHTFLDHKSKEMMLIFDTNGGGLQKKGFSLTARATNNLDHCLSCPKYSTCTVTGNVASCSCLGGLYGPKRDKVKDSNLLTCDFDNGNICLWEQSEKDDFDWIVHSGRTTSGSTGPSSDKSGSGMYVYIEASAPNRQGDTAILETPYMHGASYCLAFSWHMWGQDMGALSLSMTTQSGSTTYLFSKSGDQGNQWNDEKISIDSSEEFKLEFKGVRGRSFISDMALDEIVITSGLCTAPV